MTATDDLATRGFDSPLPTVDIDPEQFETFAKAIEAANRKLFRQGVPSQFTYTALPVTRESMTRTGAAQSQRRLSITIGVPEITYAGWTFVAHIDFASGAPVTHVMPGETLDPWTPPDPMLCQHCNRSSARRAAYILRHTVTAEMRQIAGVHLDGFLGTTPEALWAVDFARKLAAPATSTVAKAAAKQQDWDIRRVLAAAWAISDQGRKFITARAGRDHDRPSTASTVRWFLTTNPDDLTDTAARSRHTEWAAAAADVDNVVIDEILAEVADLNSRDPYGRKMLSLIEKYRVVHSDIAYVVSLIPRYNSTIRARRQVEAPILPATDTYLGVVGGPLPRVNVTALLVHPVKNKFGGSQTLITFRTDAGHMLRWVAKGYREDIAFDGRYRIKSAEVKDHILYNGATPQTVITRAKLEPLA